MSVPKQEINISCLGSDKSTCSRATNILSESVNYSYNINWMGWLRDTQTSTTTNVITNAIDVYLVSHQLNVPDDVEMIKEILAEPTSVPPVIFLNLEDNHTQYMQVIKCGAADSLCKYDITLPMLERTIQKAIVQNHATLERAAYPSSDYDESKNIAGGIVTFDEYYRIEFYNSAAETIFGHTANDIIGESLSRLLPELQLVDEYLAVERHKNKVSGQTFETPKEFTALRKNGETFSVELVITEMECNNKIIYCAALRDISLYRKEEAELRLLASVFDLHSALVITDSNGLIMRINNALKEITGYDQNEVIGKNLKCLLSQEKNDVDLDSMWYDILIHGRWEGEVWGVRKNGEHYPQCLAITAMRTNNGTVTKCVANFHDITKRKLIQTRMEHLAHYDVLTDLPNRRFLLERLEQEIARAKRENVHGALLFFDLDNFKKLNDSKGHSAGDELLQQVAKRLLEHVRTEDIVARLGGDEFVVLLPYLTEGNSQSIEFAKSIANKLQLALVEPFSIEGFLHYISASIGVSMFPVENESAKDILKQADAAMYCSKAEHQDTIVFYQNRHTDVGVHNERFYRLLGSTDIKDDAEAHRSPSRRAKGPSTIV